MPLIDDTASFQKITQMWSPRIVESGEPILGSKYLREFAAKIAKALTVVEGTSAEQAYTKKIEKSVALHNITVSSVVLVFVRAYP
jgi:hypothetical protein